MDFATFSMDNIDNIKASEVVLDLQEMITLACPNTRIEFKGNSDAGVIYTLFKSIPFEDYEALHTAMSQRAILGEQGLYEVIQQSNAASIVARMLSNMID